MRIQIAMMALALIAAGCGADAEPAEQSTFTSTTTTTSTTTSTTTTTTTTTSTTTSTTTLPPPVPGADVAALAESLRATIDEDRFFVVDEFTDNDPLRIGPAELDCNNPNSRSLRTAVAIAEADVAESASVAFRLAFARSPWQVAIVEFSDEAAATSVVEAIASTAATCPKGSQEIPLQAPDGSHATDEQGNPRFITALLVDEAFELDVVGHSAAAQLSTEFVNASGDTVQFRGTFRRGQFVVFVTGQDSEANFTRLIATADEVLRAAS